MAKLQRTAEYNERDFLQPLFKKWMDRERYAPPGRASGRVRIAGAPAWLLHARAKNEAQQEKTYGAHFTPDVLWDLGEDGRRVLELKNASKYEPLGLPEVLHHAYFLPLCEKRGSVKPTLIGRFSLMTRAALAYLLKPRGLSYLDVLEYLEFDLLEEAPGHLLMWFDDPFAPWQYVGRETSGLPDKISKTRDHWYRIDRTDSWIGMEHKIDGERPTFLEKAYKMVASIEGGAHGYVTWEGTPPVLGTGSGYDWPEHFELVAA